MKISEIIQETPAPLTETITDDAALNAEIERRLDTLPRDQRVMVLDALEVLQAAAAGISVQDWAQRLAELNQDSRLEMGEVLKTTARIFPDLVQRVSPKTYRWHVVRSGSDEIHEPELQARIGQQVEMVSKILQIMRRLGEWTPDQLARHIERVFHLAPSTAHALADHAVRTFGSMLELRDGVYRLRDEARADRQSTMDLFRRLAQRDGQG